MCGIVGGWIDGAHPRGVEAAVAALDHRGPDGHGTFSEPAAGFALGHTRLAIIDLSDAGAQPMHSDDGHHVLVYNGEIYNYRELRAELEAEGVAFRGDSDTEVVLRAHLAWGDAMLPKLNGIFAFALYDRRSDRLLLARDAMGVKPLYVHAAPNGLTFASEIKALTVLHDDLGGIDHASIHRYLTYLWCPGEGTPLQGVRKLGPGEALIAEAGEVRRRWSWFTSPAFAPRSGPVDAASAIAGTTRHLREAVRRQMVADVPVGAFLSGGLDSSAVVTFAREVDPDLTCFTIEAHGGRPGDSTPDLPYAKRVAEHLGVKLEVVRVESADMIRDLVHMVEQLDEPLADPAPLNVLYICELARRQGIKVLLSGAGGDDLFTGYRRHVALRYEALWSWLPTPVRSAMSESARLLDRRRPVARRLAKLLTDIDLSGDERIAAYFAWAKRDDLLALYRPEFREAMRDVDAAQPMLDYLAPAPAAMAPLERMLALEQRFYLADHNLNYTDKMSMATGVEVRVPFLDADLVDYVTSVPVRFKQRGRIGKWVLKEAMAPYLPRDVIHRPKTGFEVPLRAWLREELRDYMFELLSTESLDRRGLFDAEAVHALIAQNDAGTRDATFTIFSLMCIEIWCRRYLDRGPAARRSAAPDLGSDAA